MKNVLAGIFILASFPLFASKWKGPFEYNKFPEQFQVGHEVNGKPIYLGMVLHGGAKEIAKLFKSQNHKSFLKEPDKSSHKGKWVLSKLNKQYRGALYSYEGDEHYSNTYLAFMPGDAEGYTWVKASDGEVPPGAVRAWGEDRQYVCRAKWAKGVFPGRLVSTSKVCFFGFGGREKAVFVYEVLTKK